MPEFLPPPQLPTGMAEQTARLTAQQGQLSPWVALAQALGQASQGYAAGVQQNKQRELEQQKLIGPQTTPGEQTAYQVAPGSRELAEKAITARASGFRGHTVATQQLLDATPELKKRYQVGELIPERLISELLKPPTGRTATSPEKLAMVVDQVAKGEVDPAKAMKGMGTQSQEFIAAYGEYRRQHPEAPTLAARQVEFNSNQKATMEAHTTAVKLGSLASAMETQLDMAEKAMQGLSSVGVKALDAALRSGARQIDDPEAAQLFANLRTAALQYASIAKGGTAAPSEVEEKSAMAQLADGINKQGLAGVKAAWVQDSISRIGGLESKTPTEKYKKEFEKQQSEKDLIWVISGGKRQQIYRKNLEEAKKLDPKLTVEK